MDTRDYTGVEPTTRAFLEALEVNAGPPLSELSADEARTAFATAETGGFPPGGSDPVHRHNAGGFIYVLEGSVVMHVKGGKEVTLTPGQTFYEGPDDVHVVGRNASTTRPAKLLAVLVKGKGAPILVPVK